MTTKILLPVVALALIGVATFGVSQAFAQTATDAHQTLIERIATKFNLSKADVQSVFDDAHKERQADMQVKYEERLTQLVTDGKITAAQKDAITAKHKELQIQREANRAAFQNMTQTQRKAQMDTARTDLENWAKQQGIDVKYLMGFGGPHMGGRGMHMMDQK